MYSRMVSETFISAFFPLLFLVILKLCDVARSIDVKQIALLNGWKNDAGDSHPGPELGVFSILHILNYLFLTVVFYGLLVLYDGSLLYTFLTANYQSIAVLLMVVTFLIWLLLPILELSEYQQMAGFEGVFPFSLTIHISTTMITAGLCLVTAYFRPDSPKFEYTGIIDLFLKIWQWEVNNLGKSTGVYILSLVLFMWALASTGLYLKRVKRELDNRDSSEPDIGYH